MARTQTVRGRITVVQETRFRLTTDGGQSYLLTLARDADGDADDLCRLHETGAPVVVEYTGEPGLSSGLAHAVRPA